MTIRITNLCTQGGWDFDVFESRIFARRKNHIVSSTIIIFDHESFKVGRTGVNVEILDKKWQELVWLVA